MAKAKSRRSDVPVTLCYIAAALIYAIITACRTGTVVFGGSPEDLRQDLFSFSFRLSDYIAVRTDPVLDRLFLLNLLRGIALLAVLWLLMHLLPAVLQKMQKASAASARREGSNGMSLNDLIEQNAAKPGKTAENLPLPKRIRRWFVPEGEAAQPAAASSAAPARRENRPAAETAAADSESWFADLSPEKDNVRVIVKVTQRDDEGHVIVSFFCGDTLSLERCSAASRTKNSTVGSGEIKQFIRETRREVNGVFYIYDIRSAAETPVVLQGDTEDAVRLLDRRVMLRLYRKKLLFIAPQQDIRTIYSETQAPQSVWTVSGVNNTASRTRSYAQKFYQLDEGIEYEIEVRIKL
ncbi:MAG TPA: hypothetical protein DDX71_06635 [Ruminococcus sp.]|nr:hypothetical protein [Ruminococcus sp.]